ncbi:MAG: hypothetical protein P8047_13705 [Gammaproteobacteria bacterium]
MKTKKSAYITPVLLLCWLFASTASAARLKTRDRRGIGYMDERAVAGIHAEVHKLAKMHIRTEACGVAMKGMDVQPKDLITDVHAVGNGFIEAIGYQAQGYQLVPVY